MPAAGEGKIPRKTLGYYDLGPLIKYGEGIEHAKLGQPVPHPGQMRLTSIRRAEALR